MRSPSLVTAAVLYKTCFKICFQIFIERGGEMSGKKSDFSTTDSGRLKAFLFFSENSLI